MDGTNPSTGAWAFYFHDHLGSTRRIRNSSGTSVASYEFEPYGGTYATTGDASATTHQWAGLEKDTGPYHYAPYRYYNNVAMRWTTRDPLGMIDGPNMYAYVKGNPVMGIDVLGLLTQAQCAAAAALVKCERKYGTRYCAAKYSNTWGNRQYYDEINNMPFDTVGGPIDLDWFMDIGSWTGGSYGPQDFMDPGTAAADNAAYGFGKALWQIVGPPEVLPHYDDWKERQTMWLRFLGYRTFRDLFPSKFLKEECCIDRTWGDWVRDNFDYWYNPFK